MSDVWTPVRLRELIAGRQVRFIDSERRPAPLPAWASDAVISEAWTGDMGRVHGDDQPALIGAFKAAMFGPGVVCEATVRLREADYWTTLRLRYLNLLDHPDCRAIICTVEVAGPPVAIDRAVEVPWVLLFCDADDAIRSVEGMVEEVYGCTAEEIIGRTVLSLVHPDDAERCVGVAVRLLTHPTVDQFVTHRINRFDGSVGVVQSVLHRGDDYRGNLRVSQYDAERQLHNDLLDALREEQFKVVYQPVVELNGARVIGAEALVRWQHPNRGLVPPLEFIPYAETSGLIVDIGRWVLRTACREAATWPTQIRVAVNLSVRQLADENIAATVAKALLTAGLDPRRLELEITESALIEQPEQAIRSLNNLKSLGLTLAIDDFGTGYSSLAYLKRMPIDTLKIDRSFVEGLGKDDGDEAIVSSVLGLARAFRLHVVAEGVETDEQRHHLSNLGCQLAQGYLWSRPVPPDEFRSFIALPQQPTTDPVGQPGHLKQPESHAAADGVSSHIIPAAQPPHADQRCPTCGR